jgi:hypothetical protein
MRSSVGGNNFGGGSGSGRPGGIIGAGNFDGINTNLLSKLGNQARMRAMEEAGTIAEDVVKRGVKPQSLKHIIDQAPDMAFNFVQKMMSTGAKPQTINRWLRYMEDSMYDPKSAMANNYPQWMSRSEEAAKTSAERMADRLLGSGGIISGMFD